MGCIAQEILQGFAASRAGDIVDFDASLAAKNRSEAYQSHLNTVELFLRRGFDPLHAVYISVQNLVSLLCEELTMLSSLEPFVHIVRSAEQTYVPDGPPFSPLTHSFFINWAFFDVAFGRDRETMGGCIQALGQDLELDPDRLDIIWLMQNSHMGVYEHCGNQGSKIMLRDILDDHCHTCHVPAGYLGEKGQLWYVRLLPPLPDYSHSIVFTTPYILLDTKEAWLSFFDRAVPSLKIPTRPRLLIHAIHDLLKYGLDTYYWLEYISVAYVDARDNAIFLSGTPDIPEKLPSRKSAAEQHISPNR